MIISVLCYFCIVSDSLIQAIEFVHKAHSGQIRKKTGLPYVAHVYGVAAYLESLSCSETVVIAALCHDILEKTYIPPETLRDRFGQGVAQIVVDCTDQPQLEWKTRKKEALGRYSTAKESSQIVFLADKLDSLRHLCFLLKKDDSLLLQRHYKRPMKDYHWYYGKVLKYSPENPQTSCFKSVLKEFKHYLKKMIHLSAKLV